MVNSEQFAERLQKIMEFYEISAATFAEAIDVGRSSISHILSGRNKPSLDFVMKVVQTYPEVELYWLLNGKGSFPPSSETKKESKVSEKKESETVRFDDQQGLNTHNEVKKITPLRSEAEKKIIKIVLLYEDGTFETFEN